jgi:hypothetical protein
MFLRRNLLPRRPRLLLRSVSHRRLIRALLLSVRCLRRVRRAHVVRSSLAGFRVRTARLAATARIAAAVSAACATTWRRAGAAVAVGNGRIVIMTTRTASATAVGKTGEADQGGQNKCESRHERLPLDRRVIRRNADECARFERGVMNESIGGSHPGGLAKLR